jgi:hypothetical protein
MRKVGLRGFSLHSLRHSHASILLSKGVPTAVVSQRLGHADQNITLSIYSHALPVDTKAAAKVWNDSMAEVIASARSDGKVAPDSPRMLANVSAGTLWKTLSETNKRDKLAGTTGLEPARASGI